jgi:ribosomal protein L13
MADKCPKCGGKMEKGSCLAKASCGTHKADYDPRAGTGKPGMVIMIGVKGKKKDEKKKYVAYFNVRMQELREAGL